MIPFRPMYLVSLFVSLPLVGCGSSASGPVGGPVSGALDMHCVMNGVQITQSIGICLMGGQGGQPDAGGAAEDDAGIAPEFGPTLYNSEADDDDCKYHVKWTSSAIRRDTNVTFDVNVERLEDGMAATGANVEIEAFLNETHPTPSTNISSVETAGGNYRVGTVRFDEAGTWTVRFHYYARCSDSEDSPHGHVAFFVQVP